MEHEANGDKVVSFGSMRGNCVDPKVYIPHHKRARVEGGSGHASHAPGMWTVTDLVTLLTGK